MVTSNARTKAERCFALARSTKFEGERTNAIAQGTRIAEAAGLSLDLFDIPGRARKAAPKSEPSDQRGPDMGEGYYSRYNEFGGRSRPQATGDFRWFDERAAHDEAFRASWSHMPDALKRQADALRAQQARERAQRASDPAMKAMHYLREEGATVEGAFSSPRRWNVRVGRITIPPMTDAELIGLAEDVRVASEKREQKRAYEAGRQPERCARCGSIITVGVRHECPVVARRGDVRQCPGGCGKTILFGDSCVECDRAGRV